ncbi:MAG: DUF2946 family protein [Gammaproteobacteria bacterium]|jgi:hypothetical protein|nr:DUF2946 family protein [Gammaproteobacteria bacterium]MBT3488704.1 DUF2946 family protein [Gammaproteobacteria bacterium]MBT3717700.1 DUF2946 family protein [Gammaproteobacteria bacterium]MBT3844950.1 DUF2946 family protein [Gammaproteobacteria bacterium]MBT3892671.1 DUF2946 family protein [Gammaproteobacteria bacterium]
MMALRAQGKVNRIVRLLVWTLLLQLVAPTIHAAFSEPAENGYFMTLCTLQGNQTTLWINLDQDQDSETPERMVTVSMECPYCLFNLISSDITNMGGQPLLFSHERFDYLQILTQEMPLDTAFLKSLPIRAPPTTV